MDVLQRFRGVAGTAASWAAAWSVLGIVPSVAVQLFWFVRHDREMLSVWQVGVMAANGLPLWGIWGAISGTAFAVITIVGEHPRSVDTVSARRIALWGAFAGLPIPLAATAVMLALTDAPTIGTLSLMSGIFGVGALLGSLCGVASLALARRAPGDRHRSGPASIRSIAL